MGEAKAQKTKRLAQGHTAAPWQRSIFVRLCNVAVGVSEKGTSAKGTFGTEPYVQGEPPWFRIESGRRVGGDSGGMRTRLFAKAIGTLAFHSPHPHPVHTPACHTPKRQALIQSEVTWAPALPFGGRRRGKQDENDAARRNWGSGRLRKSLQVIRPVSNILQSPAWTRQTSPSPSARARTRRVRGQVYFLPGAALLHFYRQLASPAPR